MRPTLRGALVGGVTVLIAIAWLVTLARVRTAGVAGDPWAVYYPVAQGLWRGDGITAFAPLTRSGIRMPGFPVALALAAAVRPNLVEAAQVVGILAAGVTVALVFWSTRRLGGSVLAAAGAGLVVALHTETARSSLEALPDMLFVALFGATLAAALKVVESDDAPTALRRAVALGLLADAAFLTRPNGLAVVAALPVALGVVLPPLGRAAVLRRYGAGVAVGLVPWFGLMLGLRLHGISYPQLYLGASHAIEAAARQVGPVAGVLLAAGRGILDQPARISSTVPWWLALVGLGAVVAQAWRRPTVSDPVRAAAPRLAAIVGLAMGALLVPMHFEPRFYLFLAPLFVPAAALTAEGLARRSRRGRLAPVASLLLLVPALVLEAPRSRADNALEAGFGQEIRAVAESLARLGKSGDHLPVVGVSVAPRFLASRSVPTPMRDGALTAVIVRGQPTDRGLDLWLGLPDQERPQGLGAPLDEPVNHAIFTAPSRLRPAASDPSARIVPVAFRLVLPHKRQSCIERELDLGVAGRQRVVADVDAPPDLAARLQVRQGDHVVSTWTSRSGRFELGELDVAPGATTLTLCASDHLVTGVVAWRALELSTVPAPETAGGER